MILSFNITHSASWMRLIQDVTWLIHVCKWDVWMSLIQDVTWLIHVCKWDVVNESYARCDVTYSCMDCFPDVTWFMLTESHSRRDVFDVERVILNERIILHMWISHLTSCMSLIQDVEWVMLNERIILHMWISHIKSWMGLFQDATCLITWMSLIQDVTCFMLNESHSTCDVTYSHMQYDSFHSTCLIQHILMYNESH